MARSVFAIGHHAEVYGSIEELIKHPPRDGIVLARDNPARGGIADLVDQLEISGVWVPVIAADTTPSSSRIVAAIKAGAIEYIALPIDEQKLRNTLNRIAEEARRQSEARRRMIEARVLIAGLSGREREVLDWLFEGGSNKAIARHLAISPRTVEIHRANMMQKLGARCVAEAVRMRIEAQIDPQLLT